MTRIWKPIAGYEGLYEVSDDGLIRTFDRWVPFKNSKTFKRGRIRKPTPTHNGYLHLSLTKDGKPHTVRVHRVVLETFVGPCPNGMVARHLDGDRKNNRLSNLEWSTQKENLADRVAHGTAPIGENNPACILTEIDVKFIKHWLDSGRWTMPEIASKFGVSPSAIANIKYGYAWAWLTGVA